MAFKLPGIDIDGNPKTNSFLGLSRNSARFIGHIFIWLGIYLTVSSFFPDPSDLLVVAASNWLQLKFGIGLDLAYVLWHTVFAWILILIGIWIFPYNTESMFNGYINKAKKGLKKLVSNPVKLAIGLGLSYLVFQWSKSILIK